MTRLVTATAIALLMSGAAAWADEGAATAATGRTVRPVWTFVGIGAGFGIGLWAGLGAFDDSINSDRKVWTSAIVGAAAGGVLGYLFDRHRALSSGPPRPRSMPLIRPGDQDALIGAAGHLGDGKLRHWLQANAPLRSEIAGRKVSSIQ